METIPYGWCIWEMRVNIIKRDCSHAALSYYVEIFGLRRSAELEVLKSSVMPHAVLSKYVHLLKPARLPLLVNYLHPVPSKMEMQDLAIYLRNDSMYL